MEHFLDIYSRLIIATITFVAPLFVVFVSHYNQAIVKKRKMLEEKKIEIKKEHSEQAQMEDADFENEILETATELTEINHKLQSLNVVRPKQLLSKIFFWLFAALVILIIEYLIRDGRYLPYNHMMSGCVIVLTIVSFVIAAYNLKILMWEIIETKKLLDED
jgi:predicted histidine transporter YuiF (NhaC family)